MPSNGDAFGGRTLEGEVNYYALYQQTAASSGAWFNTKGIITSALQITGLAIGESLDIHCSDSASQPDDSTDTITKQTINGTGAEQKVAVTAPYSRFKKIKKTGSSTATTVIFSGCKR